MKILKLLTVLFIIALIIQAPLNSQEVRNLFGQLLFLSEETFVEEVDGFDESALVSDILPEEESSELLAESQPQSKPSKSSVAASKAKAAKKKAANKSSARINGVPAILQNGKENGLRSMPSGCEVTSAVMLMNFYGYKLNKNEFANMVPRQNVVKGVGPHPDECFVGSPYTSGFGVYAKPIVAAMDGVMDKTKHSVKNVTGCSSDRLFRYIDEGIPVVVWATIGMSAPKNGPSWKVGSTGEKFTWVSGEHCLVLIGYTDSLVWVNDPLKGTISYSRSKFLTRWKQLGQQSIIIEKSTGAAVSPSSSSSVVSKSEPESYLSSSSSTITSTSKSKSSSSSSKTSLPDTPGPEDSATPGE